MKKGIVGCKLLEKVFARFENATMDTATTVYNYISRYFGQFRTSYYLC